jgi:hypothetical protein
VKLSSAPTRPDPAPLAGTEDASRNASSLHVRARRAAVQSMSGIARPLLRSLGINTGTMRSDRRGAQQMDPDSVDPALHTDTEMIDADDFGLAERVDSTHGFAAGRARSCRESRGHGDHVRRVCRVDGPVQRAGVSHPKSVAAVVRVLTAPRRQRGCGHVVAVLERSRPRRAAESTPDRRHGHDASGHGDRANDQHRCLIEQAL